MRDNIVPSMMQPSSFTDFNPLDVLAAAAALQQPRREDCNSQCNNNNAGEGQEEEGNDESSPDDESGNKNENKKHQSMEIVPSENNVNVFKHPLVSGEGSAIMGELMNGSVKKGQNGSTILKALEMGNDSNSVVIQQDPSKEETIQQKPGTVTVLKINKSQLSDHSYAFVCHLHNLKQEEDEGYSSRSSIDEEDHDANSLATTPTTPDSSPLSPNKMRQTKIMIISKDSANRGMLSPPPAPHSPAAQEATKVLFVKPSTQGNIVLRTLLGQKTELPSQSPISALQPQQSEVQHISQGVEENSVTIEMKEEETDVEVEGVCDMESDLVVEDGAVLIDSCSVSCVDHLSSSSNEQKQESIAKLENDMPSAISSKDADIHMIEVENVPQTETVIENCLASGRDGPETLLSQEKADMSPLPNVESQQCPIPLAAIEDETSCEDKHVNAEVEALLSSTASEVEERQSEQNTQEIMDSNSEVFITCDESKTDIEAVNDSELLSVKAVVEEGKTLLHIQGDSQEGDRGSPFDHFNNKYIIEDDEPPVTKFLAVSQEHIECNSIKNEPADDITNTPESISVETQDIVVKQEKKTVMNPIGQSLVTTLPPARLKNKAQRSTPGNLVHVIPVMSSGHVQVLPRTIQYVTTVPVQSKSVMRVANPTTLGTVLIPASIAVPSSSMLKKPVPKVMSPLTVISPSLFGSGCSTPELRSPKQATTAFRVPDCKSPISKELSDIEKAGIKININPLQTVLGDYDKATGSASRRTPEIHTIGRRTPDLTFRSTVGSPVPGSPSEKINLTLNSGRCTPSPSFQEQSKLGSVGSLSWRNLSEPNQKSGLIQIGGVSNKKEYFRIQGSQIQTGVNVDDNETNNFGIKTLKQEDPDDDETAKMTDDTLSVRDSDDSGVATSDSPDEDIGLGSAMANPAFSKRKRKIGAGPKRAFLAQQWHGELHPLIDHDYCTFTEFNAQIQSSIIATTESKVKTERKYTKKKKVPTATLR